MYKLRVYFLAFIIIFFLLTSFLLLGYNQFSKDKNTVEDVEVSVLWKSANSIDVATDLNGDGLAEVIVNPRGVGLLILSGLNGSILYNFKEFWGLSADFWVLGHVTIGDLNIDGFLDIVFSAYVDVSWAPNYYVVALDGKSLEPLWIVNFDYINVLFSSFLPLADVNGDGKLEVIFGVQIGGLSYLYVLNGENGSILWKTWSYQLNSKPAIGDLNRDGYLDVIMYDIYGRSLYAFNGYNGSVLWKAIFPNWELVGEGPVLGDLDGDGILEIVILSEDEIYVLNGENGSVLWSFAFDGDFHHKMPALADVDNDGLPDVIVLTPLIVLRGVDGSPIWNAKEIISKDSISSDTNSIAIGDLDGDRHLEIVYAGSNLNNKILYVFNLEDGSIAFKVIFGPSAIRLGAPIIWDLDNDDVLEIIIDQEYGDTCILDLPVNNSKRSFRLFWQGLYGDLGQGTGNLDFIDNDNDGLSNYSENVLGTNSSSIDSDDDGFTDLEEYLANSNPLSMESIPKKGQNNKILLLQIIIIVVIILIIVSYITLNKWLGSY